jgi:superfamily I DNA and/or RNA helicase
MITLSEITNINKSMVLVYSKSKMLWEDKTDQIVSIEQNPSSMSYKGYLIGYRNSDRSYPYLEKNVKIFSKPEKIEFDGKTVHVNDNVIIFVEKIVKFDEWYRIFTSESKFITTNQIEFIEKGFSSESDIFKYYKELAFFAAEQKESLDSVEQYLANQYDKIDKIENDCSLSYYFKGNVDLNKKDDNLFNLYFPFEFNLSQSKAIKEALNSKVSIIEGPPGCGKTQTILNLIANLVMNQKTVVVVSNNNSAVENVYEKLLEEGLDFAAALLGRKENRKNFFENLSNESLNKFMEKNKDIKSSINYGPKLKQNLEVINKLHENENDLANLKNELRKLNKEYDHFYKKYKEEIKFTSHVILKQKTSSSLLRLKAKLENTLNWNIIQRLILKLFYGLKWNDIKDYKTILIYKIEDSYYKKRKEEISELIKSIEQILKVSNFKALKKDYVDSSKELFKYFLVNKFKNIESKSYNESTYKHNFKDFINRYPIVLSTSYSVLASIQKGFKFDYLIVDEASQSDLLSSVIAMYAAKNLVVVGDSKQLEQIDNTEIYQKSLELIDKYNIDYKYYYNDNSLLGSVKKVFDKVPVTLLKEHYRCHPDIANFINDSYYDNELVILTKPKTDSAISIIKLVPGNHARKNPKGSGQYNQREIDEVKDFLIENKFADVGIISPYRVQVEKYQESLKSFKKIPEIATVHKFQGRQKDTIILSSVVNNLITTEKNEKYIDFINNPKLFNVAVSRAINKIYIVTTDGLYNSKFNNFSNFLKYAEYNLPASDIVKGKISSIFDILYSSYNKELKSFLSNKFVKADAPTEVIMHDLLTIILKKFKGLEFAMHVPLSKIIQVDDYFSETEILYLRNNWTHVDFLVYNKVSKENVLVIEVDGVKYHEQNSKQTIRDEIKNKALDYIGLPILRLKTNESKEEKKIVDKLESILDL